MDKILIDYDKNLEELERQREKLEIVMQVMGQEWEVSGAGIGWLGQIDPVVNTSIEDTVSPATKEAQASDSTDSTVTTANDTAAVPESTNEATAAIAASASVAASPVADVVGTLTTTDITSIIPTVAEMIPESPSSLSSATKRPLFSKMLAAQASPSPEYLQSLLNVNEALLAQSLANNDEHSSTPMPSPIDKKNDNASSCNDDSTIITSTNAAAAAATTATTTFDCIHFDTSPRVKISPSLITPSKEDDDTPNDESINNTPLDYQGIINPATEKVISPLAAEDKPFMTFTTTNTTTTATSIKSATKKRHSYHYR